MSSECIFCKIVAGEIPSFKVYEDEHVLAFLDIRPVNAGHTLVIPKEHFVNIFDISEEAWLAVGKVVRTLAGAIEKAVGADGVNLNMNNREHAGQLVDHAHVHIIPRKKGDGLKLWPQHPYPEGEALSVAEKIRAALSSIS
ncbi:MAG: HIT family protein [bacterium]|nr:HIT family protein [bacterium]